MSKEPPRHHNRDHDAWFRNEERLGRQGQQTGSWANTPAFDAEMRRRQPPIQRPIPTSANLYSTPTPQWNNSAFSANSTSSSETSGGGGFLGAVVAGVVVVVVAVMVFGGGHKQQAPSPVIQQTEQYRLQQDGQRPVPDQPPARYTQPTPPQYIPAPVMQQAGNMGQQMAYAAPPAPTYVAPTWTPPPGPESIPRINPAYNNIYKNH